MAMIERWVYTFYFFVKTYYLPIQRTELCTFIFPIVIVSMYEILLQPKIGLNSGMFL